MTEGKRVYRSALRAEQAVRTRIAVLEAAGRCFVERGYAATTMKDVAQAAGVSVQTVFAQGSKAALLLAAVDRALTGTDDDTRVVDLEVFRRFFEADSKEAKLAAFRVIALDRGPAIDPITRAFRAAAAVDPEIATAFEEYERRRWTDMSALVGAFGTLLRPHLTVERATDVLWSVFAGDTGDRLTGYRGWTEEEYVDWMIDALDRLVLR